MHTQKNAARVLIIHEGERAAFVESLEGALSIIETSLDRGQEDRDTSHTDKELLRMRTWLHELLCAVL